MVIMATNPPCEFMGQRVNCIGAFHPNPMFICLSQFKITKHEKDLCLRFTPEFSYVVLKKRHS